MLILSFLTLTHSLYCVKPAYRIYLLHFCISPARIMILNCNSVASLTLAVGVRELMFLTLSYKSYAKVINNIVNYALINTTFSPLLLVFFCCWF